MVTHAATAPTIGPSGDVRYEWRAVALLTLGFGLVGLDRWIIAALAPSIVRELGVTAQAINYLVAILGVTWGLAALLLGGLSDRWGRRKLLVPSLILFSLLSCFSGVATGMASLFLLRAAMGVAEGMFCPASFAAVADASKPTRRGFNQGLQQSAFALVGLGLGPIIATQLLEVIDWRWVFTLVAVPGFVLAILMWKVIREPASIAAAPQVDRGEVSARYGLLDTLRHRNVPVAMVALLCAMCGIFVLSANTPLYLIEYLKLTPIQMGYVTSAIGFGGFVGQWGLPAMSDYIGRRTAGIAGFLFGAGFLALFMRAGAEPTQLFLLLFASTACSFGLLSLLSGPVATEAAPPDRISTVAGVIIGTGEIFGGGLALVVTGVLIGLYGIQAMLVFALCGLAAGVVVMLFLKETAPRVVAARNARTEDAS
ncbi:MFS transporter [Sphingomonas sp. 2SG]|uniref:MFS transporter n=1 Tax=Sphingomonas sp. 2SG TaxID=2502201 RepID=UPI0010F9512A|nr:MFS transporter [Sphingomonas sp. 2SG]